MKHTDAQPPLRELAEAARSVGGSRTEDLLARVHTLALRYARVRLGRFGVEDAAQDVAQEVCMAVLTALPTYDDRGYPFEAFVYSITARKVADTQRGLMRGPSLVAEIPERVDEANGPEAVVLLRDQASRAVELMRQLPATQQEILTLRVTMGLSAEETAAALNMTAGAVRVAQHRALGKLRALVAGDDNREVAS